MTRLLLEAEIYLVMGFVQLGIQTSGSKKYLLCLCDTPSD